MNDEIADSLDLVPLNVVLEGECIMPGGEVVPYDGNTSLTPADIAPEVDEALQQAEEDFEEVRDNIHDLMNEGMDLFKFARDMAMNTQDPDHMQGAARMFSEALKANKELMNVHRDRFALKPPVPEAINTQKAQTINNIVFKGTHREMLKALKQLDPD
jgi:hypothetical protein